MIAVRPLLVVLLFAPLLAAQAALAAAADDPLGGEAVKTPVESTAPALVFWKHIRDAASTFETDVAKGDMSIGDPRLAGILEAEVRSLIFDAEAIPKEYRAVALNLEVKALSGESLTVARLVSFTSSINTSMFRAVCAHPDSPLLDVARARLFTEAAWHKSKPLPANYGVFVERAPSLSDLEAMRKAGASFVVATRTFVVTDGELMQTSFPHEVEGAVIGKPLPLPLIFISPSNLRHLKDVCDMDDGHVGVKVERPAPAAPMALVLRLRGGGDGSRRVIVSTPRHRRALSGADASRALGLGTWLETARVVAQTVSRHDSVRNGCDIEFVHVMDNGAGFEFLKDFKRENSLILGVYAIEEVTAATTPVLAVALFLDAGSQSSVAVRAALGVVTDWRGHGGAWRQVCLDLGARPVLADCATAVAQPRLPFAAFSTASASRDSVALPPGDGVDSRGLIDRWPRTPPFVATLLDELNRIAEQKVSGAVTVSRALTLALIRLGMATRAQESR